jgi:uncharacterized membrane protein
VRQSAIRKLKVVPYLAGAVMFAVVQYHWEHPFITMGLSILGYLICVAAILIGVGAALVVHTHKDEDRFNG